MMYQQSPIIRHFIDENKRQRRQDLFSCIVGLSLGVLAGAILIFSGWAGAWILYGLTH